MKLKILDFARYGHSADEEYSMQNGLNPVTTQKRIQLEGGESWSKIAEKRLEVCLAPCEHLKSAKFLLFKMDVAQCGVCGCAVKAKVLVPNAKCPKHFW